ncbi:helix-turn-helix domain-containing protein [Jiangella alba]|uniref:Transcriptional regulator, contains XRE-family HTH domain n=1 Tax=Jiangella alba TaxID=561176 RepID=A0A1H5PZ35_9ACTN|nr:helix-turn-helix transcriptional regulator [Jiangella alba]SEF18451.1 Transcriptional regulator, contains XRE-family HTH domain [Jiangella alba]
MDVGALISQARHEARLTQLELAQRAGVSWFAISHYEKGRRLPTLGVLRAVLAAAGKQLHAELEPLDADVRRAIARVAASPVEDRPAARNWYWLHEFIAPDHRVEGVAAAQLLGAPVPVDHLDIAVADLPAACEALVGNGEMPGPRLTVRRGAWAFAAPGVRRQATDREIADAGARLRELVREQCPDDTFWMVSAQCWARVRLVPPADVERYVEVVLPAGVVRVAPLHEIESTDPRVSRALRVLRDDAGATRSG